MFFWHNRILPGKGTHPVLCSKIGNPVQLGETLPACAGAFGIKPTMWNIEFLELLQHADLLLHHVVQRPVHPPSAARTAPGLKCPPGREKRQAG